MTPSAEGQNPDPLNIDAELPSPRGVALAVMRLTQQEDVSLSELVRVLSGDPAIVGRLIKAANGLTALARRPVASVAEALMVLGLPAVRSMVTGFSLISDYRGGQCEAFDYERYWTQSLAMALGMQALAVRGRAGPADEMFSLGLLLRVGELGLATLYPARYTEVLQRAGDADELLVWERQAFATDHALLGCQMLSEWGLPDVFVTPAKAFLSGHEPTVIDEASRERAVFDALSVARIFSELCVAPSDRRSELLTRALDAAAKAGMDGGAVGHDFRAMHALWLEWCELLQFDCGEDRTFPEVGEPSGEAVASTAESQRSFEVPVRTRDRLALWHSDAPVCVLVVDADAGARKRVTALLAEEDCKFVESGSVDAGLELAFELLPHMLVLGVENDGRHAFSSIEALRGLRIGQPMHVLLHAANADENTLVTALEAGADDVVPRTAASRLLQARLRAGLREVRLTRELEHDRSELRCYAAELAVANRQLREVALTDELTGFRNRRYAVDRMQQEWSAASRSDAPLSLMVMDLDGLKRINDSHGHDAGDRALCLAAEAMRLQLRGNDVICRTGGDEFVVICPGSDLDAARACAERLREAVASRRLELASGEHCALSVSIGVAERRPVHRAPDDLLKLADRGAYLAKAAGRNRVECIQLADRG